MDFSNTAIKTAISNAVTCDGWVILPWRAKVALVVDDLVRQALTAANKSRTPQEALNLAMEVRENDYDFALSQGWVSERKSPKAA